VYRDRTHRVPAIADGQEHWAPLTTRRSRAAAALVLTAPGIPMLFMGEEFLEDKDWSDDPQGRTDTLTYWDGVFAGQKPMVDYLRFIQEVIGLRRRHPALRGEPVNVFHTHNANRVLAFHRWLDGAGRDVVVVASFNDLPFG